MAFTSVIRHEEILKEDIVQIKKHRVACKDCHGRGKKRRKLTNKARLCYQRELERFEASGGIGVAPERPRGYLSICPSCSGSGLCSTDSIPLADTEHYPHVAIIGGGIAGMALAVACLHRRVPFTLYERDDNFDSRSQGYGLTLQQASKAIQGLGVFLSEEGVRSKRHLVHDTAGNILGQWGGGISTPRTVGDTFKRSNIHIARQSLRKLIFEQLGENNAVKWHHQLIDFKKSDHGNVEITFLVNGKRQIAHAGLLVGADGIRSTVRRLLLGQEITPLRYLNCMVILGICPLSAISSTNKDLLDSSTVFQTANGNDRIYVMPYTADSIMWQLSFPIAEREANALSAQGVLALKEEAIQRTPWHDPIPQIIRATSTDKISGYPVYDRELLKPESFDLAGNVTLLGDAAHPMSPFKGQGANQALLDALSLARVIASKCRFVPWREEGLRNSVLREFEIEMLDRSASKVKDSAEAAVFLHSETVLYEGNQPRGKCPR